MSVKAHHQVNFLRNFSIFGNLNYLINESTKFSMGARWENSDSKYSDSFGESFNPSDKISGGKISINKILKKILISFLVLQEDITKVVLI